MMLQQEFEKKLFKELELCCNTLTEKAKQYATNDILHNFKQAAKLQSETPIKSLGGMMAKHTISIYDMIDGDNKGKEYDYELWEEKITDHINYLLLLKALVIDKLESK